MRQCPLVGLFASFMFILTTVKASATCTSNPFARGNATMHDSFRFLGLASWFAPMASVAVALALLPSGAYADDIAPSISRAVDLDGDGLSEVVRLSGQDDLELDIFAHDGSSLLASSNAVGWRNEPSDGPRLGITPTGSLTVTSEHLNGPSKYSATLTVAYRNQAYRIAGVTYTQWGLDFADPVTGEMRGRSCDMNLLTGTGMSNFPKGGEVGLRSIELSVPILSDWRWEMLEDICGQGAQ